MYSPSLSHTGLSGLGSVLVAGEHPAPPRELAAAAPRKPPAPRPSVVCARSVAVGSVSMAIIRVLQFRFLYYITGDGNILEWLQCASFCFGSYCSTGHGTVLKWL